MEPKILLQPSATIRPHFKISYFNKQCTLLESHTVKPYGECMCVCMYIYIYIYIYIHTHTYT